jgi:hypothetical protein
MEAPLSARAMLEMKLGAGPPSGALTPADGIRRRFSGWTELAGAIEEWRSQAATTDSPESESKNRKSGR